MYIYTYIYIYIYIYIFYIYVDIFTYIHKYNKNLPSSLESVFLRIHIYIVYKSERQNSYYFM